MSYPRGVAVDSHVFIAPTLTGTFGGSQSLSASSTVTSPAIVFSVDASSGSGVCSLGDDGVTLSYTGVGSCVVNADESGDATHTAATEVQDTITVSPAALTVTASSGSFTYGGTVPARSRQPILRFRQR